MAQLLSPVCTDLLKFQNSVLSSKSCASRFSAKTGAASSWCLPSYAGKKRSGAIGRLRVATEDASFLSTGDVADDYYAVLGLEYCLGWLKKKRIKRNIFAYAISNSEGCSRLERSSNRIQMERKAVWSKIYTAADLRNY